MKTERAVQESAGECVMRTGKLGTLRLLIIANASTSITTT